MGVLYPHADKIPKKRGKREGKGEDFERKEQNVRGSGIMDCPCVKNLEFLEVPEVWFGPYLLGMINEEEKTFSPEQEKGAKKRVIKAKRKQKAEINEFREIDKYT